MAICAGCGMENAAGVARCVFCGKGTVAGAAPPQSRTKLAVLAALVLVALILWRFPPFRGGGERDCQGGASVEVVWKTADAKAPRMELPYVNQIDPRVTPFIELAQLRSTGTRRYGENNDRQLRHLHQGVVDGLHAAGANAYFHAPSRPVGQELVETVTSAVLAHPGPIKRALRDRYFPTGRAAMIFQLQPGGGAEGGGLRVNDLVVSVEGRAIDGELPSETLLRAATALPRAEVQVLRDNQLLTLHLERQGKLFGYWSQTVPILEVTE
jgi:hypothetical protein